MDLKNLLARSYFSFGHFDGRDGQLKRRSRLLVNWMIKLVLFANATKLVIIALNHPDRT